MSKLNNVKEEPVAIVTGGASGLGRVLVEEFIKAGYHVCFSYRNSVEKAQQAIERFDGAVLAIQADASDYGLAQDLVKECVDHFGRVDVLVNNAASSKDAPLYKLTEEGFNYTVRNVLNPVFNYTKAVSPYFIEQRHGKIINIGSINGMRGREGNPSYSAAKAAVEGFSKTIAKELGPYNVNCNVVAPGFIDTDGQANTSELVKKFCLDECAIRRLTKPIEVANLVLFLAGDKSDNITGQVYKIDCGQYI